MKTKQFNSDAVQRYLSSIGLTIRPITDKDSVISLIKKLHPFSTDKDLIRLGGRGDGGYLVPDDIDGIIACFSPGIGKSSTFEIDCLKYGMDVFLADKSVEGPSIKNDKFHFIKKFIGPINHEDFITMNDWVNDSLSDKSSDLMLQMDIEGYEYLSIINMHDHLLNRFRIIVIEFHYLDKLWNTEFFKTALTVFLKILQNHTCVHIHPNNCCGMGRLGGINIPRVAEFTFIRKDRLKIEFPQTNFPHLLDSDCTSNKTIILPKCWYA